MFSRLKELFVGIVKDKPTSSTPPPKITAKIIKDTPKNTPEPTKIWQETIDVSVNFPLNQGDVLELRSGKRYQICKKTITGAIENTSVNLLWINKPALLQEQDRVERIRFKSLREMNYHLEKEIPSIVRVEKSYRHQRVPELNIEESHQLAIEEDEKRNRVKHFFNNLPTKK